MKKFAASIVCFALCAVIGIAGGNAKGGKIEGSWTATSGVSDGKKIPQDLVDKLMLVLSLKDGNYKVTITGKQVEAGTYTVDAKKKPPTVDFLIKEGKDKDKKQLGIYKLEGDKVTFAIGAAGSDKRPTDFKGGDGIEVTQLKRNK